jgi:hypothetical protein
MFVCGENPSALKVAFSAHVHLKGNLFPKKSNSSSSDSFQEPSDVQGSS